MLKGHLPRVIYHQVYKSMERKGAERGIYEDYDRHGLAACSEFAIFLRIETYLTQSVLEVVLQKSIPM